jgi:hypothetical protein
MRPLIDEVWEDLYGAKQLGLLWRFRKGDWAISAHTRFVESAVQVWFRVDHPPACPQITMLRFSGPAEAACYLERRRGQLLADQWTFV